MDAAAVIADWESQLNSVFRQRIEERVARMVKDGGGQLGLHGMWATGDYPERWLVLLRHLAPELQWGYTHPQRLQVVFTGSSDPAAGVDDGGGDQHGAQAPTEAGEAGDNGADQDRHPGPDQ